MIEPPASAGPAPDAPAPAGAGAAQGAAAPVLQGPPASSSAWRVAGIAVLAGLSAAAVVFAWNTQQRVKALETELVRRQQSSTDQAAEARAAAKQAQEQALEATAKVALLEARVAETSVQRSQLEDLIASLARSRDENVLADVDASLRFAMQQSAITGSAEPVVAALREADERLARYNEPRLERVRRAIAGDLERVRGAGVGDISLLTIRLDEAIRVVDELPLLAQPDRRAEPRAAAAPLPASGASAPGWGALLGGQSQALLDQVLKEVRALVRVTRIDAPEAMLVAPEQAFFLRENLKLRLLNARLALLSRQFDTAQADLRDAQAALERYFDPGAKRVVSLQAQLRQVAAQARQVGVPRPEATLAAIATASAGR